MKYNIGQVIEIKEDFEIKSVLGNSKNIKAGTKVYIGGDNFSHMLNGMLSLIDKDSQVEGFSVKGIADFIYEMVSARLPIDDMLEDYDIEAKDFKENIEDALEDLGFWDNTGNRS